MFEKVFESAKAILTHADTKNVENQLAVQFNVYGEGEGIFYTVFTREGADVQPYDYRDNDVTVSADSAVLLAALAAGDAQALTYTGAEDKVAAVAQIISTLAPKKAAAPEKAEKAAPEKAEKAMAQAEKTVAQVEKAAAPKKAAPKKSAKRKTPARRK